MRRKSLSLLILCALAALPAAAAKMSADDIVNKNIDAKGGRKKMEAVKSMRVEGSIDLGGGMQAPFTAEFKRPNQVRLEFNVQGMTGIQAYDGDIGWQVMPFAGTTTPTQMSDSEVKNVAEMADFDGPLFDYADKGSQIELVGEEEIEGTPAYKLKMTKKSGDVAIYYLDADAFLEIKVEQEREFQGSKIEVEESYGSYKEVGGLVMAHSIQQKPKGSPQGQTITFEKVELNVDLDDSRFKMPEPETKPGE
jgi:outer membrane lipoprotein-sorting protein